MASLNRECRSCGEAFARADFGDRLRWLEHRMVNPHPREHLYCLDCANELFRPGRFSVLGSARLMLGGRGDDEEPDYWLEYAQRILEEAGE